jgi:hypothetical protein
MPRPSHSQWGREIYFKGPGPGPGPGEERRHARHGILASACATSRVVVLDPIHSFPADRAGITHHLRSDPIRPFPPHRSLAPFLCPHALNVCWGGVGDGRTYEAAVPCIMLMHANLSVPPARAPGRPAVTADAKLPVCLRRVVSRFNQPTKRACRI